VDAQYRIINEYQNNLNLKKSLAGSQFLLAILKNPKLRFEVVITPQDATFAEFPVDDRLAEFDPADRKWIASARAHLSTYPTEPVPPIAQATDTKWHDFEDFFKEYGVIINWLCE